MGHGVGKMENGADTPEIASVVRMRQSGVGTVLDWAQVCLRDRRE